MTKNTQKTEIAEKQLILEAGWLEEPLFEACMLSLSGKAQNIGLDIKTVRAMNRGGKHKLQNCFQLEMLGLELPGTSQIQPLDRNRNWWGYRKDLYLDCDENDAVFQEVTAEKELDEEKNINFACALAYSAIVKQIETAARKSNKLAQDSDESDTNALILEAILEIEAKESILKNTNKIATQTDIWPKTHNEGLASNFRFSIQSELFPLTKKQQKLIKDLNDEIKQFVEMLRLPRNFSSSFDNEIAYGNAEDMRRTKIIKFLAQLKRLKINALISRGTTKVSAEIDDVSISFAREVLHIVLAPQSVFRVPFCLEDEQW